MKDELIRQSFDILKTQDERITELARQIPHATKSIIARVALKHGLARFTPEVIETMKGGYDIAISVGLNDDAPRSKKKTSAKRRS